MNMQRYAMLLPVDTNRCGWTAVSSSIFFLPCHSLCSLAVRKKQTFWAEQSVFVCELVSSHHIPVLEYDLQKLYHFTRKKSVSIHEQHSQNVCIFVSLFFKEPYLLVSQTHTTHKHSLSITIYLSFTTFFTIASTCLFPICKKLPTLSAPKQRQIK